MISFITELQLLPENRFFILYTQGLIDCKGYVHFFSKYGLIKNHTPINVNENQKILVIKFQKFSKESWFINYPS